MMKNSKNNPCTECNGRGGHELLFSVKTCEWCNGSCIEPLLESNSSSELYLDTSGKDTICNIPLDLKIYKVNKDWNWDPDLSLHTTSYNKNSLLPNYKNKELEEAKRNSTKAYAYRNCESTSRYHGDMTVSHMEYIYMTNDGGAIVEGVRWMSRLRDDGGLLMTETMRSNSLYCVKFSSVEEAMASHSSWNINK